MATEDKTPDTPLALTPNEYEDLRNALAFMQRTQLQGNEAVQFLSAARTISKIVESEA